MDRTLLWRCPRSLGLHGLVLDSLIEMCMDVKICVRLGGKLTESLSADVGVTQGNPLSLLLFGLFIDRTEGIIRDKLPAAAGVHLLDVCLKILLYADDLVLLAHLGVGASCRARISCLKMTGCGRRSSNDET